jgi:cell shape-determining protein MreC
MLNFVKRFTYIFIALFILCQLSLPVSSTDRLRSAMVASLSPSWRFLSFAKEGLFKLAAIWPAGGYYTSPKVQKEIEVLKLENHNLRCQLEILKAQVDLEKIVGEEAELLKRFVRNDEYAKRRKAEIFRLIELYAPSMTGKVVFREAASWSSSFWINLGEKTNRALGKTAIAKNSPVVLGTSVLGVVEYVGSSCSRVRLITDASIVPSVRVLRGSQQKQMIAEEARKLLKMIERCEDLSQELPVKKALHQLAHLNPPEDDLYLAKGEIRGIRGPFFRSRHALLRGIGFNNDYEDEEGPGRDLRAGKIVKPGDVLVTTGMDGVFPAGLRVGQISKVYPLREGASSYELDAHPLIENFDAVSFVTVLPPLESAFELPVSKSH